MQRPIKKYGNEARVRVLQNINDPRDIIRYVDKMPERV